MEDDRISKIREEVQKEIQKSIEEIDEIGGYFFSQAEEYEKLGSYSDARMCYQSALVAYDDLSRDPSLSEEKREYYSSLSSICKKKMYR